MGNAETIQQPKYPCRNCIYFKQCGSTARTEKCEGRAIMKPHRVIRNPTRNVGEPSSKYGYDRDGSQFEADLQAGFERAEFLWNEVVAFMKSHEVCPSELRWMFLRYYEEFFQ